MVPSTIRAKPAPGRVSLAAQPGARGGAPRISAATRDFPGFGPPAWQARPAPRRARGSPSMDSTPTRADSARTDPAPARRSPREAHEARQRELAHDAAEVARRIATIATLRLVVALACIALFTLSEWGPLGLPGMLGAVVAAATFAALVSWHARVHRHADRLAAAIRHHALALERLDGKFAEHPSRGDRFASPDHPYAADLDLFGRASLFQLLDATHTRIGEARLAAWLSSPATSDEVRARQEAVRELSARRAFREELEVEGLLFANDKPDPAPLLAWAEARTAPLVPAAIVPSLWLAPAAVVALFAMARVAMVPESAWIAAAVVVAAWGLSKLPKVEPIAAALNAREGALERYRAMLERIENERFESPKLRAIRDALGAGGARASREVQRLSAITGYFDARRNEVFRFFIGPVLLWDLHCVRALERWQARSGAHVRRWLEAVGELEALASLAAYAADRPEHAFPEVVDRPALEAVALGHPLLPANACVRNDVRLDGPGTALLVTGSNMSGKSTLLRAIGTNVVLAMAGAPACAESFVLSPFELRTSMRISDSLESGVSHFYAEVRHLKRVLDGLGAERTLLFLLDEILHGTNSRERRLGARAVLRHLLERGAMGAVSTHDLGLVDVGLALDARVRRVHFEEQVEGDAMTFDYRLRAGVVRSSNALRLMKMVGIDVELPPEE